MTGRRLVFGVDAPCSDCRGSGRLRGAGLDERERQRRRKRLEVGSADAGDVIPTMHECDRCAGVGVVEREP